MGRVGRVGMKGLSSSWSGPMSTRKESCFSFSAIVRGVDLLVGGCSRGRRERERRRGGEEEEEVETMLSDC